MLIGKFPFDCDTDMQLLWQVIKGIKFPERPVLSANAKDLIRSLTEPQPSQRATLPAILEHVWMQPAIKADPNFEKDEEEAALAAQQSRSARNSDAGLSGGSDGGANASTVAGGDDSGKPDNSSGSNNNDADDDDAEDSGRGHGKEKASPTILEAAAPAAQRLVDDKDANGI
jgi:serine/threonine protein kinase